MSKDVVFHYLKKLKFMIDRFLSPAPAERLEQFNSIQDCVAESTLPSADFQIQKL